MAADNLNTFQNQVVPIYKSKDLQFARFKNYDMIYGHFAKVEKPIGSRLVYSTVR